MNSLSGCLLINKRVGTTSREEVNKVSKILGIKKCGHIGTLDPFASGLLIVLVGRATKISPFLERKDKTYIATLKLGVSSDSGDLNGNILEKKEVPSLDKKTIDNCLKSFLGESEQIPPMYSALKHNGRPLYDYARKGIEIERKPRKINIFDIRLLNFEGDEITFAVKVSKGTYIRTLGEDIAKKLNTLGHLIALERIAIDEFSIKDAIYSDEVSAEKLIDIDKMLSFLPSLILDDKEAFKALNGVSLSIKRNEEEILVNDKNGAIAIYKKIANDVYSCLRGLR